MGLLEKLFPRRPPGGTAPREYFKTLTAYQPVYTTYRGGLYEMELTRAAISAFARHCSKLHLEVTGDARPDLRRVLGMQPNPFMDASKFLARLATIYLVQNNAFIVPMEDSAGRLIGYYPVLPQQSSVREYGGEPYLQYSFWGGQKAAIELNRAGILTQHQYEDDFFGSDNRPLMPTMQMAQTQAEGIINGTTGSDGKLYFNPGANLTRAQAATMIGRTQEKGYATVALTFSDAASIPSYATYYIQTMAAQGIISGYADGTFKPQANITRGQMAKILYNLM